MVVLSICVYVKMELVAGRSFYIDEKLTDRRVVIKQLEEDYRTGWWWTAQFPYLMPTAEEAVESV